MDIPESVDVIIYYAVNRVLENDRFGGGCVMMWAEIRHDGRTALVRVNGALNAQILPDSAASRSTD